ncbi:MULTISPECIES: FAD-dependent oxidoreductase [Brevibacterium]|uniref:FAD-dependent oxidoreductase n=1 Tax=Brevibacterium TaxID=1696 RepID=UPI0020124741|nr:FAD-dependent oxidoreductase [Brevibacterium sp. W7.2]
MITDSADIVIVGAGLSGAAAAWRLAEAGAEVLVLERDCPASAAASSHGSARIFRYAYPDRSRIRLVAEAARGWGELEARSGRRLLTPSGALDFGSLRNPAALADVLEAEGIDHELLCATAAEARWPQFAFDSEVLWHPGAGVIDSEAAVCGMLELACASGARVLSNWEVSRVRRGGASGGAGFTVTSFDGRQVESAQVVVAAGPYLPALLESLDLPADFRARMPEFEVRQESAFHFPYRDAAEPIDTAAGEHTSWPSFICKTPEIQLYGLPGGRDADFRGQKIAEYNGGPVLRSGYEQNGLVDARSRARVTEVVDRCLPGLISEPYAETTCLFTNVPGDDMIIDRSDSVTVVSPCSGQGAKFAPLVGELVAELVLRHGPPKPHFRASGQRFATRRGAASEPPESVGAGGPDHWRR